MKFNYLSPTSKEEALEVLAVKGKDAAILAGGTDLLVALKDRAKSFTYVIDFNKADELNEINFDNDGNLFIGAFTKISQIEKSAKIISEYPFLSDSAALLGSTQIRNRATIGGNICNASPCANLALPLLALDAELTLEKRGSSRKVKIEDFFKNNGVTCRESDEILTEIHINKQKGKGVFYIHSKRRAMDIASVGVCIKIDLDKDNKIENARIALGSVAPVPLRAKKAEGLLAGNNLSDELIAKTAEKASDEATPIDDGRASAWYRKDIVKALVSRGLKSLKKNIK